MTTKKWKMKKILMKKYKSHIIIFCSITSPKVSISKELIFKRHGRNISQTLVLFPNPAFIFFWIRLGLILNKKHMKKLSPNLLEILKNKPSSMKLKLHLCSSSWEDKELIRKKDAGNKNISFNHRQWKTWV